MIRKLTGMAIPLNNLRQWMLGLPGEANDFALDDQYRLSKLTYQQGGQTGKWITRATATSAADAAEPPGTAAGRAAHQAENG